MRIIKILSLIVLLSISYHSLTAAKPKDKNYILVDVQIVDKTDEPLAGASIQVEGTKQGTIADIDGKISLYVEKNATIIFSYIGMKNLKLKVEKALTGKIQLQEDSELLETVIKTGYQTTTKRRATGSVATINSKALKTAPLANVDALMQGQVAGVQVRNLSGRPGSSSQIVIRGHTTLSGDASPLWVVDGVALQNEIPVEVSDKIAYGDVDHLFNSSISGVNPNDIESITILKDASATAIYGSRASAGVIVITTKSGKEGKPRFNYNSNISISEAPRSKLQLMNSAEKLAFEQDIWDEFAAPAIAKGQSKYPVIGAVGRIRSGFGPYKGWTKVQQDAEIERLKGINTNWFEQMFRTAVSQNHFLSVSGGGKYSSYYISGGYSKNNGALHRSEYNRYNFSVRNEIKPNDRIKLSINSSISYQLSKNPSANINLDEYVYSANPYEQIYNADGTYAADNTYYSLYESNGQERSTAFPKEGFNIMREINETTNKLSNLSASVIGNLKIRLIDKLYFEGLAQYGYIHNLSNNINGKNTYTAWLDRAFESNDLKSERRYASITQHSSVNRNYNLRAQFHYSNTFANKHSLSFLLGSEVRKVYSQAIYTKRYGYDEVTESSSIPLFPIKDSNIKPELLEAYAQIADQLSGQSIIERAFASFYGSMDYVYNNKYVLSLSGRTDGSNNFGANRQFNPTGSIGLTWNVDQESWMQKAKPYVSSMTLRSAIGMTGNINRSASPYIIMNYTKNFRKSAKDIHRIGEIESPPNPNLRWEKTRDIKLALEMGFFDERLKLQIEGYDRLTIDAVISSILNSSSGFRSQRYNSATISNQGLEFSIASTLIKTKDWRMNVSLNMAYNHNIVVKYLAEKQDPSSNYYATIEGYPINSVFSGKYQGVDKYTGLYIYQKRPDRTFDSTSEYKDPKNFIFYIGPRTAPINGGINFSISWKSLTLSTNASYSVGAKVVNNGPLDPNSTETSFKGFLGSENYDPIPSKYNDVYLSHRNVLKEAAHRWTEKNPITDGYPRLLNIFNYDQSLRKYFIDNPYIHDAARIEDVSFLKINSLSLSYAFPTNLLKKVRISSLSINFVANNLFTFTNYTGVDPESPTSFYPNPRTFSTGINIGF